MPATRAAAILGKDGGISVSKAAAVKSTEHKNAYYVAIRFVGPGIEDGTTGVWAVTNLDSGMAASVDAAAEEFSGLPKLDGFAVTDIGAKAAVACIK